MKVKLKKETASIEDVKKMSKVGRGTIYPLLTMGKNEVFSFPFTDEDDAFKKIASIRSIISIHKKRNEAFSKKKFICRIEKYKKIFEVKCTRIL